MEELSGEVREISHHEDNERLNDAHLISVARDEGSDKPVEDSDDGGADSNDDERTNAGENVDRNDILTPNLTVRLEHVIQHLRGRE